MVPGQIPRLSPTSTVLSDGVLGPTVFPRSQCCLLLRLMFLYICSVFPRLLVLLRRSRTPSIASTGLTILLVSTRLQIIHFHRRSWSPLREGYYTLLAKSSPLHPEFYKGSFRVSMDLCWTRDSWHGVTGLCGILKI